MRLLHVEYETISDGTGLRMSLYLSGCIHRCEGCHNPESWDETKGVLITETLIGELGKQYQSNPLLQGVTLTGGDPLFHRERIPWLLQSLQHYGVSNVWIYTGYQFEDISHEPWLPMVGVLVDGPFVQELYDPSLRFRGSRNQRIIDVRKSLMKGSIIELPF